MGVAEQEDRLALHQAGEVFVLHWSRVGVGGEMCVRAPFNLLLLVRDVCLTTVCNTCLDDSDQFFKSPSLFPARLLT